MLAAVFITAGTADASVGAKAVHGSRIAGSIAQAATASSPIHCPPGYFCFDAVQNFVFQIGYVWGDPTYFFCAATAKACLIMQGDGNFVLYDLTGTSPRALWSSRTYNHPGAYAHLQASDGNLVIYTADGSQALWHVYGQQYDHLSVQIDGNMVLYTNGGKPIWQTGTVH
jgi:hypothetical protein